MHDHQKKIFEAYCKSDITQAMFINGRRAGKSTVVRNWAKTLKEFTQGFRLETSVGKVYGQDYYCVKPTGWIWQDFEWKDMEEWCVETMGPTPKNGVWTPDQRWYVNSEQFIFRNEADRVMFILRWA